VKATLVWQPVRLVAAAESWSVPVVPAAVALSVKLADPPDVVPVAGAPAAPLPIVLVVPACDRVIVRPLSVVTSPFHLERATETFRHVLGYAWQVQAVSAEDTDDDRKRANSETTFLQETFAFFEGIKPGDMAAIDKKYRARPVR